MLGAGLVPATAQPAPPPRPDALIRRPGQAAYSGNGVYNTTGAGQSRTAVIGTRGLARFYVQIQNDSQGSDSIRLVGTRESSAFAVRYFLGSRQVSPIVKDGTLILRNLAPGGHRGLTVEVEAKRGARPGSQRTVVVSARSVADGRVRDNVTATVRIPAYTSEQRRIAELVNQSRRANGRGSLPLHRQLTDKAQAWAEHMAREGRLSHSNLSSGVPPGWRSLAENVGTGTSIAGVHQAFMASSGHRANILGNFNHIGTGYAVGHGRVWICQVFMLR
jgi:uncharacterized protein YkwD